MNIRIGRELLLCASGGLLLLVGANLPWAQVNPHLPASAELPFLVSNGLAIGFDAVDLYILLPAGVVLCLLLFDAHPTVRSILAIHSGVLTLFLALRYLLGNSLLAANATLVPAVGLYLTLLGGAVLLIAGWTGSESAAPVPSPTAR
ncbi:MULTISPECIES: hypothetical protein [unclassified Haladaptatus]|uniref:hypothetical protein n=1 Tax=unclassified Haladaptatus TaxID=2622732 RepID=UPI0023E8621B|nr:MULTISPECIES: hypothetical protein [unclassified Haladaptatus]